MISNYSDIAPVDVKPERRGEAGVGSFLNRFLHGINFFFLPTIVRGEELTHLGDLTNSHNYGNPFT